jgi:transglutaminase-like putative cysteine protease
MRLKLRHATSYSYASPARGAIQILRLTPRNNANQFVRSWRVELDVDCRLFRDEDAYGNITHTFSIDGPIGTLRILVDGVIDIENNEGKIEGTIENFPLRFWQSETPMTAISPDLYAFARECMAEEGGDRVAFLHRLMGAIYRDFRFALGETHSGTSASEAFTQRAGVCQDFAHVFTACCRAINIPARYVSGYFLRNDRAEQDAGHAWAEAHIDGLGWIGFDPAHGLCVSDRYIRLAIGRDYLEAAPIRGAQMGGAGEALQVDVNVSEASRQVQG